MGRWNVLKTLALAGLLLAPLASEAQEQSASAWGYNSYGTPGLVDMPSALSREDGELAFSISQFKNHLRTSLSFQLTPRLSGTFRYSYIDGIRQNADPKSPVIGELYDRSFSLQYRLLNEGPVLPAVAIGINDLLGTGVYGGEYLVATKTLTPRLRASLGLGWGRLGSAGGFSNPLGGLSESFETRPTARSPQGGKFEPETWFRGDAALFGGVEWQATDRLRLIMEYSSDAYLREDGVAFDRKSPINLGLSFAASDRTTLDLRYLYGSEVGFQLTYALNPKRPRFGSGLDPAPAPILRRADSDRTQVWLDLTGGDDLRRASTMLSQDGIALEGYEPAPGTWRVQIRNDRYAISSQAIGRTARVLSRIAPPDIEIFEITLASNGMPVTSVTLRRSDLEELEFSPSAADMMRARVLISDAPQSVASVETRYPILKMGIEPYLTPSFFDPDQPVRLDFGVALVARYEPSPGVVFSGRIHQSLLGNLDKGDRPSTSPLPRVRSESYLYYKGGSTTIPELTAAYYFRPGEDFFGRVTVGYLETMFGGISGEILWKPQSSRLALGAELNYVKQRDFDQLFGFKDYTVLTGHLSAYYAFDGGYQGQLDIGRYLAGDVGATLSLAREFENGWRVGAFATLTDVSAAEFGEGSFDKGIELTIPLDWVTGRPTRTKLTSVIRPVQRDGGARLFVADRLYNTVRGLQASEMDQTLGRFWR